MGTRLALRAHHRGALLRHRPAQDVELIERAARLRQELQLGRRALPLRDDALPEPPPAAASRERPDTDAKGLVYGLERRKRAAAAGYALLPEGESDVQTASLHGVPAFGIPGASMYDDERAGPCLEGVGELYVQQEPGEAGERFVRAFAGSRHVDGTRVFTLGEHKDVSALHLAVGGDHQAFMAALEEALAQAVPLLQAAPQPDGPETRTNERKPAWLGQKSVREGGRNAPVQTPALAYEEDLLALFVAAVHRAGVAGEERLAQLAYLALTSRVLPWGRAGERPISLVARGTSSTGKSHVVQTVLRFFPPEAWVDLGSMSRRFLFYDDCSYSHRFLVVPEWASVKDDEEIVAMLRVLLSEGRIVHGTVEGEGKRKARRIEKAGPTGLLVTTTQPAIDPEMETRVLSVTTDDTPEQTRRVYASIAAQELHEEQVDYGRWCELQAWLAENGEVRAAIPFVSELAELMPATATRLRRDFVAVLSLVRAHAVLHQATRERDDRGRIVATVEGDYVPVRELVADVIAEGAEAGVTGATRETVEAVCELLATGGESYVRPKALIPRLNVGSSATYDRIRRALAAGYLVNEARPGERMRLAVGEPLPGGGDFLPTAAQFVRVRSGRQPAQANPHGDSGSERLSGIPGVPVNPPDEGMAEERPSAERAAEPHLEREPDENRDISW